MKKILLALLFLPMLMLAQDDSWVTIKVQYDYCVEGWPIGLEDLKSRGILIYPKPTFGYLYISTELDVSVELYAMNGSLVEEVEKLE